MKIKEISQEIHQNNINKGFWEDNENKNVGEVLMLCVSELSEALEAHRKGKFSDLEALKRSVDSSGPIPENLLMTMTSMHFEVFVKDTFEDEIADTVIRLFDLCEGFGIDIETHIRLKTNYNKTRPFKHGKKY